MGYVGRTDLRDAFTAWAVTHVPMFEKGQFGGISEKGWTAEVRRRLGGKDSEAQKSGGGRGWRLSPCPEAREDDDEAAE